MRNETVSVVTLGFDLLNVGEDVEDRSDCCFVTTPRIGIRPAHTPGVGCSVSTVYNTSADTLTCSTLVVHEARKSRSDWPWFGEAMRADLSRLNIVFPFVNR